ncbi:conserved hypothetical protein, partial [Trichinella spiralis]|uniref:hypothetical protein n=1 Tax=Trichinella spiralis TaxID=6334 RepID=UPI0001EFD29F
YKVKTKVKKSENADDTKQITDRTKQNKRRRQKHRIRHRISIGIKSDKIIVTIAVQLIERRFFKL